MASAPSMLQSESIPFRSLDGAENDATACTQPNHYPTDDDRILEDTAKYQKGTGQPT